MFTSRFKMFPCGIVNLLLTAYQPDFLQVASRRQQVGIIRSKFKSIQSNTYLIVLARLDVTCFKSNSFLRSFYQLLSENKLYSLNSTYNVCALKNLQFRFQEKNLNLNRESGDPRFDSRFRFKFFS